MMKIPRYRNLMLLMALVTMIGIKAQTNNRLVIPDVTVQLGQTQLPVYIENTDEIVAAQFDLTLPTGMTAEAVGTLSNRGDDHQVIVRSMGGQRWRVLLYSPQNRALKGQSGVVMYVPITIPASYAEGSDHQLIVTDATFSNVQTENVLTSVEVGKVKITKLPDVIAKNITTDKEMLTPGENIVVSWQVENIGELATSGGWSEQISLVSNDGFTTKLLATTYYNNVLEAKSVVSRQAELTIPMLLGIEGMGRLQIHIVTGEGTGESTSAQANNTQKADALLTVEKKLSLELQPSRVQENASTRITAKLNRSGSWSEEQTYTLTATEDSRFTVPESITMNAGQSGAVVYLRVNDNNALDEDSIVTITAEGNGYDPVKAKLTIVDNEYPDLSLTASKSMLTEGETFQLTVTTSRVSEQPITVTLTSETAKRFSFPQTVTIPAGENSVTFDITAVDDELPSLDLSNAFTASAPNHNKAEVIVVLKDNDLPVLELQLTPTTVQESAGPIAVAGLLRRTSNTNTKITVKLSDDANGGLYFGNRTLELAKGVEEVHFNFGPVDNAIVDGDRTYNITAAVWLSSCSCGASGESAGYVKAQLQVLDNDGPALNLVSSLSTLKEGGKTTLTITRNTTDNSAPLTVTLNSDYEKGLVYEHSITIPAGQKSATVEVTSEANSVQGDSHTVIFTVQSEGYAKGTCFLMITDQTLPDARINSITTDATEAEVGTQVKVTIEVTNDGAAELPAEIPVKIYHRGESTAIATIYTPNALGIGESLQVTRTITLPTSVGTHKYFAVVNENNKVNELSFTNNTSVDAIVNAIAPFTVAVNTDKKVYQQGEKILISGQLTGNGTANAEVDLYVINEGARQVQKVTTDAQGAFSYEWELYKLQSGHFSIGACYPEYDQTEELVGVDVYGIRRTSTSFITCETKVNETYNGTIQIVNPGLLPQTFTSFEIINKPDYCDVLLEAPNIIEAGKTGLLKYSITCSKVTEGKDWQTIEVRAVTKEGSSLTETLYYYCTSQHAVLSANTNSIKTTMVKGSSRDYQLNIMNTGKGSTGKITITLPNVQWMKLISQKEISSLEYGETATIYLRLTPTDDMPLNLSNKGNIAINCENGNGVSVNYNIETVSEAIGILKIDVVDEFTYYTDEKPHVSGAGVVVKHPTTGAIVAQGETGSDGSFSAELPEGYYNVTVSEGHHNSITGNVLVDPGVENLQEIFLSYNAVSYSWDVVETEVEDEYKIETIVKYETNVPKPVVIVTLPKERPAENSVIPVVITNKGLINAQHVNMNVSCTDGYVLELLNNEVLDVLAPQQAYVFYAKFTKATSTNAPRRAWGDPDSDCISIFAGALYDYICGNAENFGEALAQNGWGACQGNPGNGGTTTRARISPVPHTGPSTPGGPGGSGGWVVVGPTGNSSGWLETLRQAYCSMPCGKELTQALACEAADRIIPDWISCPYNLANTALYGNWEQRLGSALDCADLPNPFDDGCWDPYLDCMLNYFGSHRAPMHRASSYNRGYETAANLKESSQLVRNEGNAFRRIIEEQFGSKQWLECNHQDLASILYFMDMKGELYTYSLDDFTSLTPQNITKEQMMTFVERINNTNEYKNTNYEGISNYINRDTIDYYVNLIEKYEENVKANGWNSLEEMHANAYHELQDYLSEGSNSVCASVTLKLSQTMVMTRQAFRGTLTVTNGNETNIMSDVKLNLEVIDPSGNIATSHEFQINAESLDGFTGELDLTSGWTLAANATGTATVLFIPTKYAAPDEPVEWSFGGTLSYIDPFTGLEVTRELYPVTLTVKPSPELDLTYFMQRDVYGDDPLTLDVVEPMKPAEFALLINNKGYGDATNVRMVTQQPEIIENEKGLYIDFELMSSQVNGKDAVLSFGKEIANDFGNIPAHSQMYAQWWLQSSLLGHFTDYKVEATHVTSYGNEDLSLLDQVTIHELIHSLEVTKDGNKLRGFMVNDIADADDLPDMLYLTNAETSPVSIASNATVVRKSATEYWLTITPSQSGWNYGNLYDPTYGLSAIKNIVRQGDGKVIPLQNFWQTDRTLRDGKDWLYEYRIHFADDFTDGGTQTYVLTFEPTPDVLLKVASIKGIPSEEDIAIEPVDEIVVNFNKEIEPSTFTTEDITLAVQGVKQEVSEISITTTDSKMFSLNLSKLNEQLGNGYYTLTVQTAGITDNEGYQGRDGKQVGWIFFRGGLVQLLTSAWPINSGTVMRKTIEDEENTNRAPALTDDENSAQYGSEVVLIATPEEGYEFSNWTLNGEVVSNEQEFKTTALGDMDVVANFIKKSYHVEIVLESEGGNIVGAGTGIYEHGTKLNLKAEPYEDFILKGWTVNNEFVAAGDGTIELSINKPNTIVPIFEREYYRQSMTLVKGWNWVSSYLNESLDLEAINDNTNRIVGQFDELIRDPKYGWVGGLTHLKAGETYKVESNRLFTSTFRGHLYDVNSAPLQLYKGWNWVAFPYKDQLSVEVAVKNAEEGDFLVSQQGFSEFADGNWQGTLNTFIPGNGYLYKSSSDKTLEFDFISGTVRNRASRWSGSMEGSVVVDIHRYPNTMNMTILIQRDGMDGPNGTYNIYAMADDELLGISQQIGDRYYLTVYGKEPVTIKFLVESTETGKVFVAAEQLTFRDDIVGQRKSPFILHINEATDIRSLGTDERTMTVYSVEGVLISCDSTLKALKRLPKGIYIVNGQKYIIR